MAIKMIAIDMDGTLLDPQHQITPGVKQAITRAREKGVRIVLTTGRPYLGVKRYLMELDLQQEGEYCISYNGALVQQAKNGDCIAEVALSFDDYLYLEKLARQLGVHFQALDKTHLYTANQDISDSTIHESYINGIPLRYRTVEQMERHLTFPKVMMIDSPDILDSAISRLPQEASDNYTMLKSSPYYLEILNKQVNKGEGVRLLAEKLGFASSEVMAIGDQENDLAMLKYAGTSVAMGNGIDAVKAISQFVTRTNTEDGVAYAIEKFVLL